MRPLGKNAGWRSKFTCRASDLLISFFLTVCGFFFLTTRVNDVPLHLVPQVPTASVTIEGASALNRVRWSSGGKEVAVGDSEGRVFVYDTGEVQTTPIGH